MRNNDLFKELLQDPILINKYGLSKKLLNKLQLHSESDEDIIVVLQTIINGVYNDVSGVSTYKQIKNQFKIK
jgi:hypothetical protein